MSDHERVSNTPSRPAWWGPDWRQIPLAMWLSIPLTAVPVGLLAWLVLREAAPGLFGPSAPHNARGPSLGGYLCAVIAGLSGWPVVYVWVRALRKRGLDYWRRQYALCFPVTAKAGRPLTKPAASRSRLCEGYVRLVAAERRNNRIARSNSPSARRSANGMTIFGHTPRPSV
jgi:hypothetical protein